MNKNLMMESPRFNVFEKYLLKNISVNLKIGKKDIVKL